MNRSRVTGDLASHGNIFVDIANDRVGIGSTIPANKLDIRGVVESRSAVHFHESLWTGETTKIQLQSGYLHIEGGSNGTIFRRLSGGNCWAITGAGHLQAQVDSSFDIGTNAVRVRNIYADTLYGDGANLTNTGSSLSEPSSGTQRLVTTSLTSGTMTSSGTGSELAFDYANNHLEFLDNVKATFGTGGDLELYHDGSHSYIHDGGTGNLKVRSNNFRVSNADESKTSATFVPAGAVELYNNHSKKFETTSIGANVIGNFVSDLVNTIDPDSYTNHFITGNIADGSGWGAYGIAFGQGTGKMAAFGVSNSLYMAFGDGSNANSLSTFQRVTTSGAVELYHNGSKKLETTSSGVDITGTVTADNQIVLNSGDSTPARIDLYCEVSNAHYTRLQAPAHSTYSGNVTATLPNVTGNLAVLANAVDNRVVTATGTHSMTGESKLTFDGTNLRIDQGNTSDCIVGQAYSGYFGLRHADQTYGSEYMILSNDAHTYISATTGSHVYIRSGNNDSTNQLIVATGANGLTWRGSAVWHAGNDGSGSGLDADTVDGLHLGGTGNNGANQIVRTQANGYIFSSFINTTSGDTGTGSDCTRFYASQDAYLRYIDLGSMRSVMNVSAVSGVFSGREDQTSDSNYWVGSMGWGSNNFDTTVWDYGSCFFDVWSNPSGQPSGTSHWQGFQAMHYTNQSARYGFRITCGAGNPAYAYIQGRWNTTTNGWHKLWNAGNDGSGSGLDADTLDGQEGSYYKDVPSGTVMVFRQNSAPTGWTKSTSHNNKAMRIVSGNVGSGGSNGFTTALNSSRGTSGGSVSNHTLTTAQMPSHTHTGRARNHDVNNSGSQGYPAGDAHNAHRTTDRPHNRNMATGTHTNTGSTNSHNHGFSNPSINLNVQYLDFIICTRS